MIISACALFGEYRSGGNSSNNKSSNNPPNNVYTPEFHMPPQEDYDPNWDPYYKWMPENKYHDRWVEENQHNHGFDNSDYVDDHYYYDDDG